MKDYTNIQNGSDIRGVAIEGVPGEPVTLTPQAACDIAAAFALWLSEKYGKPCGALRVAVGRDSRLSGPALAAAVTEGLTGAGAAVADCGMASTPAMFMSTVLEGHRCDGAIMITASHLPYNRNGLKFFTADGGLEKTDIAWLTGTAAGSLPAGGGGKVQQVDLIGDYAAYLADKIRAGINDPDNYQQPLTGLKIAVDAGNGAGGFFATRVLEPLGADTSASRFLEPDGAFPNHIPNPEDKTAMASITEAVLQGGCDLGLIFDTDVDRAAAVDSEGREINRNRLVALMSAIVLADCPGSTIVTDSVTSSHLAAFIERELGGVHRRFKRGYKNVINESIRLCNEGIESPLAIETSGHGALRENFFLDDGAYLSAKIIIQFARLRREGKTIGSLLAGLGEPAESAELRFKIAGGAFGDYGKQVLADLQKLAETRPDWQIAPDNHEGIRISFNGAGERGWLLLRMSLHDPLMPLNIESDDVGGVRRIAAKLGNFLAGYDRLDTAPLHKLLEA